MTAAPPLVLTQGDPSGIGPEIALAAWRALRADGPAFAVVGDPGFLSRLAANLGLDIPVRATTPEHVATLFGHALPVIDIARPVVGAPGRPANPDAAGTIAAIETAVGLVVSGAARAIVTNPIAKHVLYAAGFAHPGHTEFLAELALRHTGVAARPVMLLWSECLAVVPITVHVALARAPALLTRAAIVETGRIVAADLRARFGLARPRLAFAGLNPHAGENGAMGREEIEVMAPAIAALRAEGVDAIGPLPADTMFHAAARAGYDVALAPTHDQALIPIKTLAFDSAVNVTLGLPFVRTSPDHGTAYDIAGKGSARPDSLIAAIRLADRLTRDAAA
jgi:4-hydroxythreonine-4-phosphate dehydrogenase